MHNPSPTGDPRTDALLPVASNLVWAVKATDADDVAEQLAEIERGGRHAVRALLIVLAAMVPDDQPPSVLVSWLRDPDEYRLLRETGIDTATAMAIIRGKHAA